MKCVVGLVVSLSMGVAAFGQTPTLINYQGRLLNGTNLVNGTVSMALRLYPSAIAAGFLYEDTGSVVVVDGLYSTFIGDGTTAGTLTNALTQTNVYIEVEVNGVTLAPRERLASVAYAIRSGQAEAFGGAIADSQLSTNVARLNGTSQAFSGPVTFNNVSNVFAGTFSGTGTGTFAGAFAGTLSGNGSGVTNVPLAGNGNAVTNVELLTLASHGIMREPYFTILATPGVGVGPECLAAADLTGDGKVDLISGNKLSGTITVLINNGNGGFISNATYNVIGTQESLATADVNGDGRIDMVSANSSSNLVSIYTNNGNGFFTLTTSPGVGNFPAMVKAADLNGDSKVDLVTANFSAATLTVLTNNGNGTFTLSSSPPVGNNPTAVTVADVNGDGKPDLVCANSAFDNLSVLTNSGNAVFTLTSTPLVGDNPNDVAAADFNGDGSVDLASANVSASSLTVLTNNGSGFFFSNATYSVDTHPQALAAADITGDGKADLICANNLGGTISILTNNGAGVFGLLQKPVVGTFPDGIVATDLNGDNRLDLVTASESDNALDVLLQSAQFNGTFNGLFTGDGSGLRSAAGWVREGTNVSFVGGNVGIGTTTPTNALQVIGTVQATAYITGSDRNSKENFAPVSSADVLDKVVALPISTWNFKRQDSGTHMGPMAQDFKAAFGLGNTDSGIFTVDADGVALAAIQALAAENTQLKSQVDALKARLDAIEVSQPPPN